MYKSGVLSALNPRKTHMTSLCLFVKKDGICNIYFLSPSLFLSPLCVRKYISLCLRVFLLLTGFACKLQAISLDRIPSEWDYVPLLESPDNMCISITSISWYATSLEQICVRACLKKLHRERHIFLICRYMEEVTASTDKFTAHCN